LNKSETSPLDGGYQIQGTVVSAKIAKRLPLELIESESGLEVVSSVSDNPWTGVRIGSQRRYAAIYRNGKAMTAGCTSIREADKVLREVKDSVAPIADVYPSLSPQMENMVAMVDTGVDLNLNSLAVVWGLDNIEYEPEQFPGLMAFIPETTATALIFSTGKIVITGVQRKDEVAETLQEVYKKLTQTI
jgi:transcription initiation factor TFIID TATA-box-binding protein